MNHARPPDNATYLRMRRLPDQLDRARARVRQLERQAERWGLPVAMDQ
jgi:hypothetical protein